jgi:hypothetical protein
MKKLNIVLGALIGMTIAYLLFAFVQMDFNAGNWLKDTRFGCALMLMPAGLIGGLLAMAIDEETKKIQR